MPNLKNKKIVIYSPINDHYAETGDTARCLSEMKNLGYNDITVVTNNSEMANSFKNSFLIINPGTSLWSGHGVSNITDSNFFAYGNE